MVQNKLHIIIRWKAWVTRAFLVALFFCIAGQAHAQLMNIQLVVENEFAIRGLRAPDWGLIPAGSGETFLPAGDEQAGRFTISATENTQVLLTLDTPAELVSDNGNSLVFAPEAAFVQDGLRDAGLATPIAGNRACFPLSTGSLILDENIYERIQELRTTVFLYGKVYVGDVAAGVYSGVVTVRAEYL